MRLKIIIILIFLMHILFYVQIGKCDKNYYEKLFIDGAHFKVSSNSIISNNLLNFISMNGN